MQFAKDLSSGASELSSKIRELSSEALELGSEASELVSGAAVLVSTFVSAHRCRVTGDAIFKITRHTEGKERIMQKRRKFRKKVCVEH